MHQDTMWGSEINGTLGCSPHMIINQCQCGSDAIQMATLEPTMRGSNAPILNWRLAFLARTASESASRFDCQTRRAACHCREEEARGQGVGLEGYAVASQDHPSTPDDPTIRPPPSLALSCKWAMRSQAKATDIARGRTPLQRRCPSPALRPPIRPLRLSPACR